MEKYNALTNEMPSLGKVYENPENLKAIKQIIKYPNRRNR
jgi:hypothetical protein